ncbi:MAG: DUF368 domain-containing protein [Bacteroidetes bacterium]|nr:DUF368 domain-containing protein [Bacteroidota bacterium]MDA1335319.1 DUF368 domain-containing protein [Bacteroidota bacterium]
MKRHLGIYLRGMAMGIADLIPGVSGGTIALITGIYDPFIGSISSIKFGLIKTLKNQGIKGVWEEVNGAFLVALFAGIATSLFTFSTVLHQLLEHHPSNLFAFFFGLIAASVPIIWREVTHWKVHAIAIFLVGVAITFSISLLPPASSDLSPMYLFVCGCLAACAMILPGISGSFILLLLGAYSTIIQAVKDFELSILIVTGLGVVVGLLGFSKGLKSLLSKHRNAMMALLVGLLFGSLNAVWPWKENGDGREVWLQANILPNFESLAWPIVWAVIGFFIVFLLDRWTKDRITS